MRGYNMPKDSFLRHHAVSLSDGRTRNRLRRAPDGSTRTGCCLPTMAFCEPDERHLCSFPGLIAS